MLTVDVYPDRCDTFDEGSRRRSSRVILGAFATWYRVSHSSCSKSSALLALVVFKEGRGAARHCLRNEGM